MVSGCRILAVKMTVRVMLLVWAIMLVACGGGDVVDRGTRVTTEPTSEASSPSASPSATSSPLPSPAPSPSPNTFSFGDTVESATGNQVTVYRWDTDVNWPIEARPGKVLSQIEAKFCVGPNPPQSYDVGALHLAFSLEMPDHARIASESQGYNGDEFLVQTNLMLGAGECARGLVIFQSPKGKRPDYVVFSSSSVIKRNVP
jgi:hypothetical protein